MKVKICGITRIEDALLVAEMNAWAIGFIFYKKSPRYIEPAKVRQIIDNLPVGIKKIGVFVNSSVEEMNSVAEISGINTLQLHGEENPEMCNLLPYEIIKAFRPENEQYLKQIENFQKLNTFLIDAKVQGEYGGTGIRADWQLAKKAKSYGNIILAGGINSENIISAIKEVSPYAIDLSSAVEDKPGIKNQQKIKELFNIIREYKN